MNVDTETLPPNPAEKIIIPNPNARPDGFWSLPGGKDGIQGTPEGVCRAIDALEDVPRHAKTALKEKIASALEDTDFNYVKILARSAVNDTAGSYRVIGHEDIEVSKKNL